MRPAGLAQRLGRLDNDHSAGRPPHGAHSCRHGAAQPAPLSPRQQAWPSAWTAWTTTTALAASCGLDGSSAAATWVCTTRRYAAVEHAEPPPACHQEQLASEKELRGSRTSSLCPTPPHDPSSAEAAKCGVEGGTARASSIAAGSIRVDAGEGALPSSYAPTGSPSSIQAISAGLVLAAGSAEETNFWCWHLARDARMNQGERGRGKARCFQKAGDKSGVGRREHTGICGRI